MSTYAIGDLQGCYQPLQNLLELIDYNTLSDKLWFTGDIVNRGPDSLACLRFVKNSPNCQIVLGNHDLHCLTAAYGYQPFHAKDTLTEILKAPDADDLLQWLIQQPLLYHDPKFDYCLVHAGILPAWDLATAKALALEAETALQNDTQHFLKHLYGHQPDTWSATLTGMDRYRFIVNAFTRMRYCLSSTQLELKSKMAPEHAERDLIPWFDVDSRKTKQCNIIFGHWASLNCQAGLPHIFALDSGAVWGGKLTALRLEDGQRFSVVGI